MAVLKVRRWLVLAVLATAPASAHAQLLTLEEALHRADGAAFPIRVVAGEAGARAGQAIAPLRGLLPSLRVEGGYVRTTDPLGAFGFSLRQRAITLASFNPDALNNPRAIGNLGSSFVIEQPLVNADAWLGRRAAVRAREAATATLRWTRAGTAVDVVRAYFGAVLAADRISALEAGRAAGEAHVRQAESLLRNGQVTRSDALIAAIKLGEVESALIAARDERGLSRQRLALTLGEPGDTVWTLPVTLPEPATVRHLAEGVAADTVSRERRADLEAIDLSRGAAEADLARARSTLLPRVNSFGRLDWNTAGTPFGGRESWTVGVMVSWFPFSGASELGEIRSARGRVAQATAAAEATVAQAGLERQQTSSALQVAVARLEIAARAVGQSVEAHRIVSRKYDGGLATVVELTDAAAIETQTRLAFADARYQTIVAAAERRQALGLDLSPFAELDP